MLRCRLIDTTVKAVPNPRTTALAISCRVVRRVFPGRRPFATVSKSKSDGAGGAGGSAGTGDPKAGMTAEERRRYKQMQENRRKQMAASSHRPNKQQHTQNASPLSGYSFGGGGSSLGATSNPAAAAAAFVTANNAASGKPATPSLFGETSGVVAYQNYQPYRFRLLTVFGVASCGGWTWVGLAAQAAASAALEPSLWSHPAWSGIGMIASVVFLSASYTVARRTVAELIWLSNGYTRCISHNLLWGTKQVDLAPQSINMQPLTSDALSAKKLIFRIPSGGAGTRSARGQTMWLERKHNTLCSAAALRHIFGWDSNLHAPGGGADPALIDQFTERVFGAAEPVKPMHPETHTPFSYNKK